MNVLHTAANARLSLLQQELQSTKTWRAELLSESEQ
jgi:hypothetical protein